MPNTESAKKRLRQTEVRTARNKAQRSAMRTHEKAINEAILAGDKAKAEALLPTVYRHLDKAAKKNIIHANTAANHKSRLASKIAAL